MSNNGENISRADFIKGNIAIASVAALAFSSSNLGTINRLFAQSATSTLNALEQSFYGESNAAAKYAEFAKSTKNSSVSAMFKAASEAEIIHADMHIATAKDLKLISKSFAKKDFKVKVGSDEENIKTGIEGEEYEFQKMYPAFSKVAYKEKQPRAWASMDKIAIVEKAHARLFIDVLNMLNAKKGLPKTYYLCKTCGYIEENTVPNLCPICSADVYAFEAYKA